MDPISRRMFRDAGQRGPIVLMYHSVTSESSKPRWKWAVSQQGFCRQLDLLKAAGWTTIRFSDLLEHWTVPEKSVAITFDDGYADNFPAFEALCSRGMTASWFVVTKHIGGVSGWTNQGALRLPMLSKEQLLEMQDSGMEIGAHSRTHARLTELDIADLRDEVTGSREDLGHVLGRPIDSFAYPYGSFNEQVVQTVGEAGYKIACTTRSGAALNHTDILRVKRLAVYADDDLPTFARKLAFIDNEASWGRLLRHKLSRVVGRIKH